ncbi:zinc finger, PMZ-type containing protein [Tanacetum coccineum]
MCLGPIGLSMTLSSKKYQLVSCLMSLKVGFENGFKVDMYHEYNDYDVMAYTTNDNLFTKINNVDSLDVNETVVEHEESDTQSLLVYCGRDVDLRRCAGRRVIRKKKKEKEQSKRKLNGKDMDFNVNGKPDFHRMYVCIKGVKDGWIARCRKAIVDVENKNNWCWFLSLLADDLDCQEGLGVTIISDAHKVVEVRKKDEAFGVNLVSRSCDCRLWNISGVPCVHAVAVFLHFKMNPDDDEDMQWEHFSEDELGIRATISELQALEEAHDKHNAELPSISQVVSMDVSQYEHPNMEFQTQPTPFDTS